MTPKNLIYLTFLTLIPILHSSFAKAEPLKTGLPSPVLSEILLMENQCRDKPSEKITTDAGIVQQVDITNDGLTDYIINDGMVDCEMGVSFRHGNGGTGIIIFVGTKDGVVKAFEDTVHDIRIEQNTAWVLVGGHYCGQESFSKATAKACERSLVWNEEQKKLELAPLSQARFK